MAATKRAAGFVVFRRLHNVVEYLLMQTSYGIHHWSPPKGHVDPGETDIQTAFRETQEEAGLTSNDLKIYGDAKEVLAYNVNNDQPKIVIYWLAELINNNKEVQLSSEHQAFKWLPLEEACSLANYSDMQNTLKVFNKYILEHIVHS